VPALSFEQLLARLLQVVVAVKDPNPQVAGRGISRLEKAGIQVTCPCLQDEAYDMNREWMQSMEAAAAASAA
jgi:diaminohydroxyphosphoribosylaminopyrimidine deaminase / 5-amino-6-(5-phosphoribosylamino)uracil reductase